LRVIMVFRQPDTVRQSPRLGILKQLSLSCFSGSSSYFFVKKLNAEPLVSLRAADAALTGQTSIDSDISRASFTSMPG
ncbi:hypothetical protein, partial [Pantoea ananatis]|uniref:hypothetical protein n=1 Tax=Pantoea ananas TaxID=553 RepID=UPI001B304CA3